jgi:hypothetical protein
MALMVKRFEREERERRERERERREERGESDTEESELLIHFEDSVFPLPTSVPQICPAAAGSSVAFSHVIYLKTLSG